MLLQSLLDFTHANFEPPSRLYNDANVRYIVELTKQGQAVGWYDKYDPATNTTLRRPMPQLDSRSSNIVALPFFGHAEYTFGLLRAKEDEDEQKRLARLVRADKSHAAYIELVQECLAATQEPAVQAVLSFLQKIQLGNLMC